jgi:hypothetical protein
MINRTLLIADGGLFSSWAERLSREYERVLWFRPWSKSFSHPNDYYIGTGYEAFERVEHFWKHVDEADTIAFFDIHFPDWATHLKDLGKPVWSGFYGENLELDRLMAKEVMEQVGLPVNKYEVVYGMDELREFLQSNDNQFVKIPKLRGLTETFESINYDLVKVKLDDMEHKLGGASKVQQFICEEKIDAITETGYDGWCIDGQFPKTAVIGAEIKDCGAASVVKPYGLLPKEVKEVNQKLAAVLGDYGYQGFWSTEIRVTKKSFFATDFTCRAASPCGENLQELFSNMGEVIEAGAHGQIVEPKPVAKYAVQAVIESTFAESHWLPIDIPEEIRPNIKLYNCCVIDGQEYIVPTAVDMPQVGSVVCTADTLDAAIKKVENYSSQIEAYQLKVNIEALQQAKVELEKAA